MKVLYLANGLPHYFNLVLSKLNSTPGLEIVVVTPKGPGKYIGDGVFQTREGIGFRVIELSEYSYGLFVGFRGLPWLLLRERPDLIVFAEHLLPAFFLHPGLALARRMVGARMVLKSIPFRLPDYGTARQRADSVTPGWRRAWRRLKLGLRAHWFRALDAHVNYIDDARQVFGSYGVSQQRIFVTRNSPDTDAMARTEQALRAEPNPPQRHPQRILHVGRLTGEKKVDLLLDAMPAVRERLAQAELVIVGDGPQRAAFEARAAKLGLAGAVRFTGAIYDPLVLGREFLSASLYVLPGLGGLSINEAMFYGLAVVCAAGDGTERHLVREGENGSFFRADDRQSLAEAMVRVLADPGRLALMGARSRQIIDREVNIGTVVAAYREAFASACA